MGSLPHSIGEYQVLARFQEETLHSVKFPLRSISVQYYSAVLKTVLEKCFNSPWQHHSCQGGHFEQQDPDEQAPRFQDSASLPKILLSNI